MGLRFVVCWALLAVTSLAAAAPGNCARALLPKNDGKAGVVQTASSAETLYAHARAAQPTFNQLLYQLWVEIPVRIEHPGLKDPERVLEKARAYPDRSVAHVLDVLRAAILCDSLEQVRAAAGYLSQLAVANGIRIAYLEDRFQFPRETGYRDIQIGLLVPVRGPSEEPIFHVAEVQIHLDRLYILKKKTADGLYREIRRLEEALAQPGATLTSGEEQKLSELKKEHRRLFDLAFAESQKAKRVRSR